MDDPALKALREVANLSTVDTLADIWRDDVIHVDGIHSAAFDRVLDALARLREGVAVGNIFIEGRPGIGKSHFLGRLRHAVVEQGQVFVLFQPSSARKFWNSLALAYLDSLQREVGRGEMQLRRVLRGLGEVARAEQTTQPGSVLDLGNAVGLADEQIDALVAGTLDTRHLQRFRNGLRRHLGRRPDERTALDVAVALALLNSEDCARQDLGNALLQGHEVDAGEARAHAIHANQIPCREVVRALDRLVDVAGATTLVAIDQLDALLALEASASDVAVGLMDLAEDARHSLVVLSCLIDSWEEIGKHAVASAPARYPSRVQLRNVPSADVGEALVAAYLGSAFARAGFTPPYPTWPVRPAAFADAVVFSPRSLIKEVLQKHCERCLAKGRVTELKRLLPTVKDSPGPGPPPPSPPPPPTDLDPQFDQLVRDADVADALDEKKVDGSLPALLRAGLSAWVEENREAGDFKLDPWPLGRNPGLHARLRQVVDADRDDEVHWSFRAVLNGNATAALSRLRTAVTESGCEGSAERRRLFVLRNAPWSRGAKTQQVRAGFEAHGGVVLKLEEADLRVFRALQQLLDERRDGLDAWLRARRPASGTTLLAPLPASGAAAAGAAVRSGEAVGSGAAAGSGTGAGSGARASSATPGASGAAVGSGAVTGVDSAAGADAGTPGAEAPASASGETSGPSAGGRPGAGAPPSGDDAILIGVAEHTGRPVTLPLEHLRRHAVIFAGSGSGKTVLIRRLVEECALRGVSAIVLDPNNDLARLGLPWPEPPAGWLDGDAARAEAYLRDTEVVVWTPRLTAGRPLSFAPLAGLGDVADDPDEFEIALDNAVGLLAPRSGLPASGRGRVHGRAVLKEALRAWVRGGGGNLQSFLGFLSALPAGVSQLANGVKLAADIGQTLLAETVNDPMLGGASQAVDPAVLLQPPPGRRARISVVSLVGLPNDDQRQHFVNQLQMALFAWVRTHPAGDRPLGGLFVMDEAQNFAPSGGGTATTDSTLALAAQARKYGLGLVFATQAPKGLHNQIPGNATTQFFGLLNAPVQIRAAQEMAAQKGGDARGIARLRPGEFFAASDGVAFQRVRTPMCLSHHPRSPMTREEVLAVARGR